MTGFRLRTQSTDNSATAARDLTGSVSYNLGSSHVGVIEAADECIYVPKAVQTKILKQVIANFDANGKSSYFPDPDFGYGFTNKDDLLAYASDLDFLFGGYWIEVPVKTLLVDYGEFFLCIRTIDETFSG
jgi:hypothetical protein